MTTRRNVATGVMLAAAVLAPAGALGADWPTYRADGARSGYTSEELPAKLVVRWVHRAPQPPQPAWPDLGWQHMPFDFAHQVIVAGGTLYYGSSADCHVYAVDTATGEQRWSFCTDGPVRFAPAAWRDRLFVVSDDGCLYCLRGRNGELLWKVRAGPAATKILGNGRMISTWPARAGPVVRGDTVYFGAGVFPTQGFFLQAIDAESGRAIWTNDTAGNLRRYQYNHGFAYSNVAAQGYLAIAGDTLLVPTGRAVPAAFSLRDGRLLYYHPLETYRTGGAWVMAADKHYFNDDMAFHVQDGSVACPELGARPEEGTGSERSPFHRTVRMIEGAATPELLLIANGKQVRAVDRRRPFVDDKRILEKWCTKRTAAFFAGAPRARLSQRLQGLNVLWEAPIECSGTLIVAGSRAYAGSEGTVSALDLKTRKVVWQADIQGAVHGLAASGGRLYASTSQGLIYCFGQSGPAAEARARPVDATPFAGNELYARAASEIIDATGIGEGYCLDLGCGDGRLSYELATRTNLRIYAADDDEESVQAARKALHDAGLYGTRVTVHHLDLSDTGYPPYFADLIVSARSVTRGEGVVPEAEMKRLQRPCGGVAVLGRPGAMTKSVRGPLPGSGSWSHQYGSAANTCASADTVARGPLGILWFGPSGPSGMAGGKLRPPAPLYANGRVYIPARGFLRCLNAYNGRVLWEHKGYAVRGGRHYMGANTQGSNVCATDHRVYYIGKKNECVSLDGATGKPLGKFPGPRGRDGERGAWGTIACADGLVFGTLESGKLAAYFEDYLRPLGRPIPAYDSPYHCHTEGVAFFALDAKTGQRRWIYKAKALIPHNGIAIGGGRVHLLDRPHLSGAVARARRRGDRRPTVMSAGALVALDAKTGNELWRNEEGIFGSLLALSVEHGVLVMGFPTMRRGNFVSDLFTRLAAHRASDGERLWEADSQYHQRPLLVGRTVIVDPGGFDWTTGKKVILADAPCGFDLITGEPRTRRNPVTGEQELWAFGRTEKCSGWTACPNLIVHRTGTISYYDILGDAGVSDLGGIRPHCFINVFPAGGLVLAPDNLAGCTCNYIHRTSAAFRPLDQKEHWALFMGQRPTPGIVKHLALNVGAIGDRRGPDGTLWLAMPRPLMQKTCGQRVDVRAFVFGPQSVTMELDGKTTAERGGRRRRDDVPRSSWPSGVSDFARPRGCYHLNAASTPVKGTDLPWVFTSGAAGALKLRINVSRMPPRTRYQIGLYFLEIDGVGPGERVFDVKIGEETVLSRFDIVREAGGRHVAVVKKLDCAAADGALTVALHPVKGKPLLSGLRVTASDGALPQR